MYLMLLAQGSLYFLFHLLEVYVFEVKWKLPARATTSDGIFPEKIYAGNNFRNFLTNKKNTGNQTFFDLKQVDMYSHGEAHDASRPRLAFSRA